MIPWTVHATIRTSGPVDEPTTTALARSLASPGCFTRTSGAPGLRMRFSVQADTHACAYGLALDLLVTDALPLLGDASLTDLRLIAGQHGLTPSAIHP